MNNDAVVIRFTNGDIVMGALINETETHISLQNLVSIKTVVVQGQGGVIEKTITAPFCSMTEEKNFSFNKDHVIFVKPLHPALQPLYWKIADSLEDEPELHTKEPEPEEDDFDDSLTDSFVIIPETKILH